MLKFKLALCAAAIAAISPLTWAQSKGPASVSPAFTSGASEIQWEYLVLSYGKTVFGAPEKTLAYRAIGLPATAQEANGIQKNLDILGRFGWELVEIVGQIGGDQQLVFKRRFDRNRATNEASNILKGKELYLRELVDIWERERRIKEEADAIYEAEKLKPRLIELDEQDAANLRIKMSSARKAEYSAAIAGTPWGSKSALSVSASPSDIRVEVKVDVTDQALREGNSYRKSEVNAWLKQAVLDKLKTVVPSWGFISITASATINFQGGTIEVASERALFSSSTGRWF